MIKVTKSTHTFVYGKCVQVAICEAFNEKMSDVDKYLNERFGERHLEEGYTDKEIDVLCRYMGEKNNVEIRSVKMRKSEKFRLFDAVMLLPGAFIATTDAHCVYIEKGVIYDTLVLVRPAFLYENLTSLWAIKKEDSDMNKVPISDILEFDRTGRITKSINTSDLVLSAVIINEILAERPDIDIAAFMSQQSFSTLSPGFRNILQNFITV